MAHLGSKNSLIPFKQRGHPVYPPLNMTSPDSLTDGNNSTELGSEREESVNQEGREFAVKPVSGREISGKAFLRGG